LFSALILVSKYELQQLFSVRAPQKVDTIVIEDDGTEAET
jgi:hypothetical protein